MKYSFVSLTALSLLVNVAIAAETPADGQKSYMTHGCANCHGANGVHPTSKHVPILKGKPATYLYENASAIFDGTLKSGNTRYMHDQFCIGEVQAEGCYPAPGPAELKAIAAWLGGDDALPGDKKTDQGLYVTSVDAYKRLQELGDRALLVDIRTRSEVAFVGMPSLAHANIPYMDTRFDEWDSKSSNFKLQANGEFTLRMEALLTKRGLDKSAPVFLICRSGNRTAKAANILRLAGFEQVYTVTDGFEGDTAKEGPRKGERVVNGWKNAGLPWTYKLDKEAMYWDL